MKKIIIIIIALVAIVGIVFAVTSDNKTAGVSQNNGAPTGTSDDIIPGTDDRAVKGTVVSVDVSKVPVDGPGLVIIQTDTGLQAVIAVPSMGMGMCAAKDKIENYSEFKAGDKVEVRGQVGAENMIIPCESAEHYLRVSK